MTAKVGLKHVLDRPMAVTVELLWRWTFGFVALTLYALAAAQVFADLVVSEADQQDLFASGDLRRALDALSRVLSEAAPLARHQLLWLLPCLGVLWLLIAVPGRAAVCSALNLPSSAGWGDLRLRSYLAPVAKLQSARLIAGAVTIAVLVLLSGLLRENLAPEHLLPQVILFALLAGMLVGAWLTLNSLLAMAPAMLVERVRGNAAPLRSLLLRWKHAPDQCATVTLRFFGLKLLAFVTAFSFSVAAVGFVPFFGVAVCLAALGIITLIYCAACDIFFLARLSAFARIGETRLGDEIFLRDTM